MRKKIAIMASLTVIIGACAVNRTSVPTPTLDRPEWIDQGSGAFGGDVGVAFYGVGAADAKTHPTVTSRRTASGLNARAELARSFKTEINDLLKAYERVVSDGEIANVEVFSQQATTAFTSITLTGAFIVDRYFDTSEQVQYALTRMSISDFKKQIEEMEQLSEEVQETIMNNAEDAFQELVEQE